MGREFELAETSITILGAGFVGTTTAVVLAERGHRVQLVEPDPQRRDEIRAGRLPFHEPGLQDALRGALAGARLRVLAALDDAQPADVLLVCVGTPGAADGHADLDQVRGAAGDIGTHVAHTGRPAVVAVKSTVPPGTTQNELAPRVLRAAAGVPCAFAMVPEFLAEGSALHDARHPSRVVIGAEDPDAAETLARLFQTDCPTVVVDIETAELIKYAANGLLATKIAYANEIGNLAEALGRDVDEVMAGVGLDPRIGPHFLQAGLGFGGSCFPKDVAALHALARDHGVNAPLLATVLAENDRQPLRALAHLHARLGDLTGRRIALLGLAFKPDTSDVRASRALVLYDALVAQGSEVRCHDPIAGPAFCGERPDARVGATVEDVLKGADGAVVQTAWPEYAALSANTFLRLMRRPLVVDGRRVLDARALRGAGVEILPIGNGKESTHESRDPRSRPRNEVPARYKVRA